MWMRMFARYLTLITKDVMGWFGGVVGGAYGISDSMYHHNGVLGLTMGVCLFVDAAHTVSQKP